MTTIRCGKKIFSSIQAVLFDKDGTLADVEGYLCQLGDMRWQRLCAAEPRLMPTSSSAAAPLLFAFGLVEGRLDPAGLLAVGSRQENEVAAATFLAAAGWKWVAALTAAKTAFCEAERSLAPKVEKTPLLKGAAPLITRLKQSSVKVGIVSADLHSEVEAFVEQYRLKVDWYWGAGNERLPKTHPDFLRLVCQEMAIAPPSINQSSVLIIGDSASDLLVATQGSCGFVGMTGGWSTPPNIDFSGVEIELATVSQLNQVEVFA